MLLSAAAACPNTAAASTAYYTVSNAVSNAVSNTAAIKRRF